MKCLTFCRESFEDESNGTFATNSVLNFVPLSDHNGQFLICRSENPRLPGNLLEDKWLLNIYGMNFMLTISVFLNFNLR